MNAASAPLDDALLSDRKAGNKAVTSSEFNLDQAGAVVLQRGGDRGAPWSAGDGRKTVEESGDRR